MIAPSADIARTAAYTGMVIGACISFPQLWRIVHRGTYAGVSSCTWALAFTSYTLWCAYGLLLPIAAQVPGNVVAAAGTGLVLRSLARRGAEMLLPVYTVAAAVACACVMYAIAGASGIGWLAFATSLAMRLPQLRLVLRATCIEALAVAPWALSILASGSWLVYASLSSDFPIVASSISAIIMTSGIIAGARRAGQRIAAPDRL